MRRLNIIAGTILLGLVCFLFLDTAFAATDSDGFEKKITKTSSVSLKSTTIFKGQSSDYIFFGMQTVKYAGESRISFCGHWDYDAPSNSSTLCKDTWKSDHIKAGIGAIIQKFRECKGSTGSESNHYRQCYFLSSIAIHKFLQNHGDDSFGLSYGKLEISGTPGKGWKVNDFLNAGENAYTNHSKSFSVSASKGKITLSDAAKGKYTFSITKVSANDSKSISYSISSHNNASCSCNGSGSCTATLSDDTKTGSCTVAVTANRNDYNYAAKYYPFKKSSDCSGGHSGKQPLIPNKLLKQSQSKQKKLTFSFSPTKGSVKFKITACKDTATYSALKDANIAINGVNGKTNAKGEYTNSNLVLGQSYSYTVTASGKKTTGTIKVTKNNSSKTQTHKFKLGACGNSKPVCTEVVDEYREKGQLSQLYSKIQNGEIECDNEGGCAALNDPTASNYGYCQPVEHDECTGGSCCEYEKDQIVSSHDDGTYNDLKYKYELHKLFNKYKEDNYTELLNYDNPECSAPQKIEPETSCESTTASIEAKQLDNYSSLYTASSGTTSFAPVCSIKYDINNSILSENNDDLVPGMLLWKPKTGDVAIEGVIDVDCSTIVSDSNKYSFNNNKDAISGSIITGLMPTISVNSNVDDNSSNISSSLQRSYRIDEVVVDVPTGSSTNMYEAKWHVRATINYRYPQFYKSHIGTGILTAKTACNNCIRLGYGLPIPMDADVKTYTGSMSIAIPGMEEKEQNCKYALNGNEYFERQISYDNPFGERLTVGKNWCSFDSFNDLGDTVPDAADIRCISNPSFNATINNYIKNRPNSDNKDNNYVMYSFVLSPKNLNSIRSYNKGKQYTDFSGISCDNQGDNCFSKFVTEAFSGDYSEITSGYCKNNRDSTLCTPKSINN